MRTEGEWMDNAMRDGRSRETTEFPVEQTVPVRRFGARTVGAVRPAGELRPAERESDASRGEPRPGATHFAAGARGFSPRSRRPAALAAASLAASLLLAACSSGGDEPAKAEPIRQQPKSTAPYWVDPDSKAAAQTAEFAGDGRDGDAKAVRAIAEQPVAQWIGPENAEAQAKGFTEAATKADREALLVLYNIPHRDCGNYSGGGAADGDAYRSWIEEIARGIGDRRATVVLEPDAVLHLVDGCTPGEFHEERFNLLRGAVEHLGSLKNTTVYLDAGNSGWGHPDQLPEPLYRAGIEAADGFAVNVSNFYSTEKSVAYGKQLSQKVGNKPFVVDTSRNGNGPYAGGDPKERWCNPPGRALGDAPTVKTGDPLVKAYLWVKRPGESDGTCKGGPKAGEWWPEYALGLAKGSGKK